MTMRDFAMLARRARFEVALLGRSAGMLKRRLPRCQILGFYKSLADQGLADPQLVQQRKEPRDGYHARCPAQTQAFSEAVGTESDRSGSVDPMYRGVFAAPRPHGSGTSGRGRSLRTAAPGADCALLGPEDAATVVAR